MRCSGPSKAQRSQTMTIPKRERPLFVLGESHRDVQMWIRFRMLKESNFCIVSSITQLYGGPLNVDLVILETAYHRSDWFKWRERIEQNVAGYGWRKLSPGDV